MDRWTAKSRVIPADNSVWTSDKIPECKYKKLPQCDVIPAFPNLISSVFILTGKEENTVLLFSVLVTTQFQTIVWTNFLQSPCSARNYYESLRWGFFKACLEVRDYYQLLVSWVGWGRECLDIGVLNGPLVWVRDDKGVWSFDVIVISRGKQSAQRSIFNSPCPPQIPPALPWNSNISLRGKKR